LPFQITGVRIDYRRGEVAQIRAFYERLTDANSSLPYYLSFVFFAFLWISSNGFLVLS
jgi:hypothetical protein